MSEVPPVQLLGEADTLGAFNAQLGAARRGTFLLDFDGTLAPFWNDVQAVRPYPGVAAALDRLAGTGRARIVIVTGRYLKATPPDLGTSAPAPTMP